MSSETVEAPSDYKLTPSSGMPPIPDFKRCLEPTYSYTKTVTTSDNLRIFAAFKPDTRKSNETVEAPSDYKLTPSSGMPPIPDFKRCLDPGYSYTKTVTTSDNLRPSLFAAFKPVSYES